MLKHLINGGENGQRCEEKKKMLKEQSFTQSCRWNGNGDLKLNIQTYNDLQKEEKILQKKVLKSTCMLCSKVIEVIHTLF